MRTILALLARAACIVSVLTTAALAQDYPARPVRIVVPFPPGAFNDIIAREIGAQLSQRLGKQFIVENKAGAGGAVAGELVANAPKDGHTLMIASVAVAINPWLVPLSYDPIKAFTPVAIVATAPVVAVINPNLSAKTAPEFVALAKKQPGDLKYGSSGVGTFLHLAGELFKVSAGIDLLHVPYRGAGPALIEVVAGHLQAAFASVPSVANHVRSGKLRAIMVGGKTRSAALPNVPTAEEAGLPSYQAANWIGLVAPAGTPEPVVALLHKEISQIQDSPDMRKRFAAEGVEPVRMSVADFGKLIVGDHAKWGKVIKDANIKPQ